MREFEATSLLRAVDDQETTIARRVADLEAKRDEQCDLIQFCLDEEIITTTEMAARLGITRQALSKRLARRRKRKEVESVVPE